MALEIQGVQTPQITPPPAFLADRAPQAQPEPAKKADREPEIDLRAALQDLEQVSLAFNRRLQFSINKKIDQIVVKVVDQETDKVIKEIPPRELQIVHERIRDAIGLLFDEQI